MRLRDVYGKTLYDRRHGVLWWSVGISVLTVVTLSAWPSVRDEYQSLLKNYPKALLAFFGVDRASVGTGAGYLQTELFGLLLPLMLIAYMIAGGSSVIAGEEEAGSLELLLAQPVGRTRVLLEKFVALCTALLVIVVAFVTVTAIAAGAFSLDVSTLHLAAASFSAYALAVLYGAVALLAGAATGHRALAAGIASAAAVAAYLLTSLAALVTGLEPFRPLSPFWWYSGHQPLLHGLEPLHLALLVVCAATCVAGAGAAFDRRDIT